MPQIKRDAAHRYFEYEEASDKSTCLLCKIKLKGKHATNLKNHLAAKHLEEYKVITDVNKNTTPIPTNSNTDALSPAPVIQKIKNVCIRLVTVHGRPLAMMEDEAFQDLVNMAASTKEASKKTNVKAVKKSIQEEATHIRNKISAEVKNKLISLKIDAATCQERKFIGINIQYVKEAKITIRNLAVLEIFQRQTAEFLRSAVEETLAEFKISVEQIYCICTDNGSNMVKMVKIMGGEYCLNNETVDIFGENDDVEDDQDEDGSTNYTLDDFFIDLDINNLFMNDSFKIRGMLCAAHTLQLAVKDAIEENVMAQNTINTARKLVNMLRAPNNANSLKRANLRKAIKDCPTRWSSTFNMLERLLSLREFCNTIPEITVTLLTIDSFWDDVRQLIESLKPATLATQILQKEQFTIGDFFIAWFNCKNDVKIINSHFATSFHQAMERREVKLMQNDVILEGLYLDGRLNVILSTDQCQKASNLLSDVCRQMRRLQALMSVPDAGSVELIADISGHSGPSTSRAYSALEQMLLTTERIRGARQGRSFDICLYEMLTTPRLPLTEDILVHWQNKSVTSSELSMVANIVLGAPMTQVSVERLFSSLKFILSPLRSNLGSVILKDIMVIRENKDLL